MTSMKNNLFALFLLGSLVPFSQVEGKQYLRRKAQEAVSVPVAAPTERKMIDYYHYVVLELEYGNQVDPNINVNGTEFVEAYNSLVNCPSTVGDWPKGFEIITSLNDIRPEVTNSNEFTPTAKDEFPEDPSTASVSRVTYRVLMQVEGFIDWDFFDTSEYTGAENSDCSGPRRQEFVQELVDLGLANLKNATLIPLLDPNGPDGCDEPTYSDKGVCPGGSNKALLLLFPTESPSNCPTPAPTEEEESSDDSPSDDSSSEESAEEPTIAPTLSPTTKAPSSSPSGSPTTVATSPTVSVPSPTAATASPTVTTASPIAATASPTAASSPPTAKSDTPTLTALSVTPSIIAATTSPTASPTVAPTATVSTPSPTADRTAPPTEATEEPTGEPSATALTPTPTDATGSPTDSPTNSPR